MKKSFLHRLFKLGAIPNKMLPIIVNEGIVISDEGMAGWFITKDVKGPGKRYRYRKEGFSGWLAVTNKRILCYTFSKRQINISVDDPRIGSIHIGTDSVETLSISFESSVFREEWEGEIELRFKTEKAQQFYQVLSSICTQQVAASDATKPFG